MEKWVDSIEKLSNAAYKYPQAVYSCFTKSLQCEWIYLQRVIIPKFDELYIGLKTAVHCFLVPEILGREVLQKEYALFELPVKYGGLALRDPKKKWQK